jgi:hypothetical protein
LKGPARIVAMASFPLSSGGKPDVPRMLAEHPEGG